MVCLSAKIQPGRQDLPKSATAPIPASGRMPLAGFFFSHYSPTIFHLPHSLGVSSASLGTSAVMAVALFAQ